MKVKTIVLLGLSVLAFSACGSQPVVSEPQTSLSEIEDKISIIQKSWRRRNNKAAKMKLKENLRRH